MNEHRARPERGAISPALLGAVVHELRTPLCGIAMLAAKHAQSRGEMRDDALRIVRATRRMERLIRELADFAQLEAGALALALGRYRVLDCVERAVAAASVGAPEHAIDIAATEVTGSPFVTCDPERIHQVLLTMLERGIERTRSARRVTLTVACSERETVFGVEHAGAPMTDAEIESAFTPVVPTTGTGGRLDVSLYIARRIVEAHGGRMTAERLETGATRVSFSLPTEVVHAELLGGG